MKYSGASYDKIYVIYNLVSTAQHNEQYMYMKNQTNSTLHSKGKGKAIVYREWCKGTSNQQLHKQTKFKEPTTHDEQS